MIDLTKLTPAPWEASPSCVGPEWGWDVDSVDQNTALEWGDYRDARFANEHDAKFIALARNAFDVMMRRGWSVRQHGIDRWAVQCPAYLFPAEQDPFTALVEADKWYREHVEGKT